MSAHEPRCNEHVMPEGEWQSHPCGRPIFEDGKCKIHCASAVEKRRAKSQARWDAKLAASPITLLYDCRAERDRLAAVNAELCAALERLISRESYAINGTPMKELPETTGIFKLARAALAKSQEK